MKTEIKRHRGGQPGNINARKHGYYSDAFVAVNKANLTQARQVFGLDEEIVLMRATLKAVARQSPPNFRLMSEIASTLIRMVRVSEKLGFNRSEPLDEDQGSEDIDDIVAHL